MYSAMTESEANQERFQLLKPGEYDAVIAKSEDKVSASSGNPMMDITLHVYDEQGTPHNVRDFMVFTKSMMWKVIMFANSAGLLKEYEEGKLCSEVAIDHNVRVKVSIEEGSEIAIDKLQGKPFGTKYPAKNKIDEYVKKEDQKLLLKLEEHDPFEDDDLPTF